VVGFFVIFCCVFLKWKLFILIQYSFALKSNHMKIFTHLWGISYMCIYRFLHTNNLKYFLQIQLENGIIVC